MEGGFYRSGVVERAGGDIDFERLMGDMDRERGAAIETIGSGAKVGRREPADKIIALGQPIVGKRDRREYHAPDPDRR